MHARAHLSPPALALVPDYRPGIYFLRLSRSDRSLTGRVVIGGA